MIRFFEDAIRTAVELERLMLSAQMCSRGHPRLTGRNESQQLKAAMRLGQEVPWAREGERLYRERVKRLAQGSDLNLCAVRSWDDLPIELRF